MPTKRDVGAVTSLDSPVLVRDLESAHQNPNIPRSIFLPNLAEAAINDDGYTNVTDASSRPGSDFVTKSISVKARQMKAAFDANGESGNAGDWLVHFNGHYMVVKADNFS